MSDLLARVPHEGRVRPMLILILFLAVNLALLIAAAPETAIRHAADGGSWLDPAKAMLEHGGFVEYGDPATPQTFRQPLYPAFLAGFLWLGGGTFVPVLAAQIALLFLTGWMARSIVEDRLAGYGDLALALIVFNPSALGTAHLIQSDTLFAFLMVASLWAMFAFARRPGWRPALLAGLLFGFACLTRSTGQFLLLVWPVMFPIIAAASGERRRWRAHLGAGLLSLAIAVAAILPWMAHNYNAGEGFSLTTARLKSAFLWDNIAYLEKYDKAVGIAAAEAAGERKREAIAASEPKWQGMSPPERYSILVERGAKAFVSYPPATFARAFGWAWAQFFGIPGASNLVNILELTEAEAFEVFVAEDSRNYIEAGIEALRRAHPMATVITVLGFVYVFALRGLGLVGLAAMVRRRDWAPLLITVGGISYFALIHLFVANSRYRLPIEPLLVLLAIYGLDAIRQRRR